MLTFKDFQYFESTARLKSVSKAAKEQFVSQPAVSLSIKKMENYFNTSLFIRNRTSLELSEAGMELYPHAKELLALQNKLYRSSQLEDTLDTINIAILSLPLYQSIFYSVKAFFNTLYPTVTINIDEYQLDVLPDPNNYSFICFSPELNSNSKIFSKMKHWKVHEIMNDTFCLICSQQCMNTVKPISISKLYSIDTLKRMSIYDEQSIFSHLKKLNFIYEKDITYFNSTEYDAIVSHVKSNSSCLAILPSNFIRPYMDSLNTLEIIDLNLFMSYHYIAYNQMLFSRFPQAETFLNLLFQEIRKYV